MIDSTLQSVLSRSGMMALPDEVVDLCEITMYLVQGPMQVDCKSLAEALAIAREAVAAHVQARLCVYTVSGKFCRLERAMIVSTLARVSSWSFV